MIPSLFVKERRRTVQQARRKVPCKRRSMPSKMPLWPFRSSIFVASILFLILLPSISSDSPLRGCTSHGFFNPSSSLFAPSPSSGTNPSFKDLRFYFSRPHIKKLRSARETEKEGRAKRRGMLVLEVGADSIWEEVRWPVTSKTRAKGKRKRAKGRKRRWRRWRR